MATRGRPTKYLPEYCEAVLEAGDEGLSLTAFAGIIKVDRDTITEWVKVHPEFSLAVKGHQARRTLKLERDLMRAPDGPNVTSRIFALKNAAPEDWRDKQDVALSGGLDVTAKVDMTGLSPDQLRALASIPIKEQ